MHVLHHPSIKSAPVPVWSWTTYGKPSDERDDREVDPLRRGLVERVQRDEEREGPELEDDGRGDAAVDDLAEVGREEQHEQADHGRGDGEEVGLRGGEAEVLEREGQVNLG